MKIVYCLNSIRYLGGIQRITAIKANAIAEIPGNEVYVVVTDNKVGHVVQPLSTNVQLVDMDINYYDGDCDRSKLLNILVYKKKMRLHKRRLEEFLRMVNPDIVVAVGGFEKYMLLSMKKRTWKVIREFHFERFYRKKHSSTPLDRIKAFITDFYDFHIMEKKYDKIILLTEEDRNVNWHGWDNIAVIPNPVSFICDNPSELKDKTVTMVGRYDPIKNCGSMIRSFKMVVDRHPDWCLKLYGDGPEKELLLRMISDYGLQNNVYLMGFTSDVREAFCHSSIATITSLSEGFSLAIVEAMECGVPVVSYQCPCGPKELITEGVDGFLVAVNDEKAMADRICQLIEDEELRKKMGAAAKEKTTRYHIDNITKQWMDLFEELIENK